MHLASCGESLRLQTSEGSMRYDEIRAHVEKVLRKEFDHRIAEIGEKGPRATYTPDRFDAARTTLAEGADAFWKRMGRESAEHWLELTAQSAGISRPELEADRAETLKLLHVGMRAVVDAIEGQSRAVHSFDLVSPPEPSKGPSGATGGLGAGVSEVASGKTLAEVVDLYINEQVRVGGWAVRTRAKREATLGVLVELLGGATPMDTITKKDAQDVKSVLLKIPANKNKNPKTQNLSLREAANVPGVASLSPATLNGYLGAFHMFAEWAARNSYATGNLFEGMKVRTKRNPAAVDQVRKAFSPEAVAVMVKELTRPDSKLVKKEGYRWASLIGIFTGARLNEVCSLRVADVQQHDGIWCFSINDEDPNGHKSLKSSAARRLVPVHSSLIKFGLLDYVAGRAKFGGDVRLFPDFAFSDKHGYTKNQGRWFNTTFLEGLGLNTEHAVFHALRHTMVTRLHQADVPQPLVQTIVGHEREGVTMKTYFSESYKVAQLKDAVEKYHVAET